MDLNLIKKFSDDMNQLSPAVVGGKAFSLADLYQRKFSVPNGFIITTQALDYFLRSLSVKNDENILSQIHKEGDHFTIHMADIQQKIIAGEMPPELAEAVYNSFTSLDTDFVAVRSSATVEDGERYSYAGQFESFLRVAKENLLSKVKLCWSSLFNQRAISYSKNTHNIGKMAVIIQEMITADISGVCFSIDPVNNDTSAIIIELIAGLGDSLVQGAVVPDRYIICKESLIIKERHVTMGAVIEDNIIKEVARVVKKIEELYNKPIDIEWAVKNDAIFILQARPITTFNRMHN